VHVLFHIMVDEPWEASVLSLPSVVRLGGLLITAEHYSDADRTWSDCQRTRALAQYRALLEPHGMHYERSCTIFRGGPVGFLVMASRFRRTSVGLACRMRVRIGQPDIANVDETVVLVTDLKSEQIEVEVQRILAIPIGTTVVLLVEPAPELMPVLVDLLVAGGIHAMHAVPISEYVLSSAVVGRRTAAKWHPLRRI
jgi:hypothetical protein